MSEVLLLKSEKAIEIFRIYEISLDSTLGEWSGAQRTADYSLSFIYMSENILVSTPGAELVLTVDYGKFIS